MEIILTPLALILGFVSIFLTLLHLTGGIGGRRLNEISKRLEALEKDVANLGIKSGELASGIEEIRKKNEDHVKLFRTVVYGFDYIVQGCKAALGVEEGADEVSERIVPPTQQWQIPEAEDKD